MIDRILNRAERLTAMLDATASCEPRRRQRRRVFYMKVAHKSPNVVVVEGKTFAPGQSSKTHAPLKRVSRASVPYAKYY